MTNIEIQITGSWKWIAAELIDSTNAKTSITLNGNSPVAKDISVDSAAFARLVIHASGTPGDTLTADVLRDGKSLSRKRYFKFDGNGHLDRTVTFDPQA